MLHTTNNINTLNGELNCSGSFFVFYFFNVSHFDNWMENTRGFNDDDGGDDTDRYKLMYPLNLMNMFISISLFDILPDVTYAHLSQLTPEFGQRNFQNNNNNCECKISINYSNCKLSQRWRYRLRSRENFVILWKSVLYHRFLVLLSIHKSQMLLNDTEALSYSIDYRL